MNDEPQQRVGELLAAWRAEHDPGASERARMWTAIAARAGADDPWMEESSAGAGVARAAVRPRLWIGAVAIAAAAVLAVAIAPRARELARTVAPSLQQSIRAVLPSLSRLPEPQPQPVALQPATIAVPPTIAVAPVIEAPIARTRPRREPRELASPASIDPAEVELLERAQRRLASDPTAALALFEQHARDYPRSELAAERELGRADARCRSGDAAGARELVDRFTRSRSGSPLLARMRSICAEQAP